MSQAINPPPAFGATPVGLKTVTKNNFFTYIAPSTANAGVERRCAIQVWNVVVDGWTCQIFTGGTYDFGGQRHTNTFHKKHLVTVGNGDLATKSQNIFIRRTVTIDVTNTERNRKIAPLVAAIKAGIITKPGNTVSGKGAMQMARDEAAKQYFTKGYGTKLVPPPSMATATLTVIDCAVFAGWARLAEKFAQSLMAGANGTANGAADFKTDGIWHPTVDFGIACVYECPGGTLPATAKTKAKVQFHLLKVDTAVKSIICHVMHLAEALD